MTGKRPLILFYTSLWGGLVPRLNSYTYKRILWACARRHPGHAWRTLLLPSSVLRQRLASRSDLWLKIETLKVILAPETGCELTDDRSRLADADAVIFHMPTIHEVDFGSVPKRPGQVWVAWSRECELKYTEMADEPMLRRIDLTMYYHFRSDIPAPYVRRTMLQAMRRPPRRKAPGAPAIYFASSPYNGSGRHDYVRELMARMPIDSYGRQLQNQTIDRDHGRPTKLDLLGRYKFTLAFENNIARDYVTEKFFDPLRMGSVPVYLGAPNVADFAPGEKCYIDTSDFRDPQALADYLMELDADDTAYQRFFDWKTAPFRPAFMDRVAVQDRHPIARLCDILARGGTALQSQPDARP
jgi:hypothetical protein